jgi:hypothetical protein
VLCSFFFADYPFLCGLANPFSSVSLVSDQNGSTLHYCYQVQFTIQHRYTHAQTSKQSKKQSKRLSRIQNKMPRTDWIEQVSQANWPAARVRNVIKAIKEEQMAPAPPKQRMTREDGIQWLASEVARMPVIELEMTRPVDFLTKYFLGGSSERDAARNANIKAKTIVHGTTVSAQYATDDKDCAPEWMIGLARADLAAAPAPAPAPTQIVVPEVVDLGIRTPPPAEREQQQQTDAPGAPAPESRTAPRHTPEERARIDLECAARRGVYDDADDHLFEEPLSTLAEVAERLESLRLRVDAHVAERIAEERAEIAEQQRKDDRAALNRLSDRLVSTEMELGLIDDALDHMYAGQQSPANVVGRLAAIIKRITKMDI